MKNTSVFNNTSNSYTWKPEDYINVANKPEVINARIGSQINAYSSSCGSCAKLNMGNEDITMDVNENLKEKLVDLLDQFVYDDWYGNGDIAEELIANGVTVRELDGCKYCKEYEDLPEHFIDGKPVGRVSDTCIQTDENGLWHIEVPYGADIGIQFCPMCGRKLPRPQERE